MILVYLVSQLVLKYFIPASKPQAQKQHASPVPYDTNTMQPPPGEPNPWKLDPQSVLPAWETGTTIAVHVYLSQSYGYDLFSPQEREVNGALPSVSWNNITWGSWDYKYASNFTLDIPLVGIRRGFVTVILIIFSLCSKTVRYSLIFS
jgi:hypothetical protein